MMFLHYSDQMTSLPSPSPRMSDRRTYELLERVGSLKPWMKGDFFMGLINKVYILKKEKGVRGRKIGEVVELGECWIYGGDKI